MNTRRCSALRLVSFLTLCCAIAALIPEPCSADEIDDLLNQVRRYEFGQDAAPTQRLDELTQAAQNDSEAAAGLAQRFAAALADPETTSTARGFLCRLLAVVGTVDQLPALLPLVRDPELSHMALYALNTIQDPAVDRELIAILPTTDGPVATDIATVLGSRGPAAAVPALAELAGRLGQTPDTASAACAALGRIGTPAAAQALRSLGEQDTSIPRALYEDTLLVCVRRLADSRHADQAQAMAEAVSEEAQDALVRAAALYELARLVPEPTVALAMDVLESPEPALARMAVRILRETPGAAVGRRIARTLPDLAPETRVRVLQVLADRGDSTVVPAVLAQLGSDHAAVRVAAITCLGVIGNLDAADPLLERCATGPRDERRAARESILRLHTDGMDQALRTALDNPQRSESVRAQAAQALGARGAGMAVDSLLAAAAAEGLPELRSAAVRALRAVAGPAQVPALLGLHRNASGDDLEDLERTLLTAVRTDAETADASLAPVIDALGTDLPAAHRLSLLRVVGRTGGGPALDALRQALTPDADPTTRIEVVRLLAGWGDDAPLDDLWAVASAPGDELEQALAWRGFVRLLALDPFRPADEAFQRYYEAMAQARTDAERKLVLAGLGSLGTSAALDLAAESLDAPGLRAEAEVAVVSIARTTAGHDRKRTAELLRRIVRGNPDSGMAGQAEQLLGTIAGFGDFVTAWEVSPAYSREGVGCSELFDTAFAPETEDAETVHWKPMPAGTNPDQPWLIDLLEEFGGEQKVAYLRTRLWSDTERALRVEQGSDDGTKVWVNGELVFANNVQRGVAPNQESYEIQVRRGWNEVMVKVTQNVMGWGLCFRVCDVDGSSLDDICFDTHGAGKPARKLQDELERYRGYIGQWERSPVYTAEGKQATDLFDMVFPPEETAAGEVVWTPIPGGTDYARPWLVDLKSQVDGDQRVAFLRTAVRPPEPGDYVLEIGTDDGVKVFVNGELLHGHNAVRGIAPAQERVRVRLDADWNTIMLKVTQSTLGWEAAMRVCDPTGAPVRRIDTALPSKLD